MSWGWFEARFGAFAHAVARWSGSPVVFAAALLSIVIWAAFGPYFDYSQVWQLVVNMGTTICTFLMVFVIQNSQNRDGLAIQIKLDEIIRAVHGAKNSMIDLEDLSQAELDDLRSKFAKLGTKARKRSRKKPTSTPAPSTR